MKLEQTFEVARARAEVAAALDDDDAIASLFPDTVVESKGGGVRETRTPAPVGSRAVRFVFTTRPNGNLDFEKICDGNIWRSLEGEISLVEEASDRTRIALLMTGRTRALVPELTIRGPLRAQLEQMARALRERLERA